MITSAINVTQADKNSGGMMIDFVELIKDLFVAATLAYAALGSAWLIGYVLVKYFGFKKREFDNENH